MSMEQAISRDIPVKESALQINPVVFDELTFKRLSNKHFGESKVQLKIGQIIQKLKDSHYRVIIKVEAVQEEEFSATVQISGYCTIDENDPAKDQLLKGNTLAILFPYIRSELTLLTAQPETDPIVWPVMNIQAMMDEATEINPDDTKESMDQTKDDQ